MQLSAVLFDIESSDESGLVAVGLDLLPWTLVSAYQQGVFPWYSDDMPICWWSPDPRAIFELHSLNISHRLARTIRSNKFEVTFNQAFGSVMLGCADRPDGTWITDDMLRAYTRLHEMGFAHSVETWIDGALVGGIYGVALGGLFAGESMFHRQTDASKVAMAALFARLREREFTLFDTQLVTDHTLSMGAIEIPRACYLERLTKAIDARCRFGD